MAQLGDEGSVNLNDHKLNMGIYFRDTSNSNSASEELEIPESIGRMISYVKINRAKKDSSNKIFAAKPCSTAFKHLNQEIKS